jgi:hypothetical protein
MIDFKIKVDDARVQLMLDQLPKELQANIAARLDVLTTELQAKVRAAEPHRTGRLQTETRRFVDQRENWVRGRVRILGPGGRGHNVAAAALEYGAHRSFPVKGYRRGGTAVSAYRRHANIAERRFLRNAAEGIRPKVLAELQQAIADSIADVKPTR